MGLYDTLGSDLIFELDSRDASTIFEDTAATDAAEDGDSVAAWLSTSHSSVAVSFTQGTGISRPLYDADVGDGLPGIDFDGSNDHLIAPHASNLNITNPCIVAVVTLDVTTQYQGVLTKDYAAFANNYSLAYAPTAAGAPGAGWRFGPDSWNRAAIPDTLTGQRMLLVGWFNGTSSHIFRDGVRNGASVVGANPASPTTTDLQLGRAFNSSVNALNGRLHHLMLLSDIDLIQLCEIHAYLMDWWGISGGPPIPSGGGASFPPIGPGGLVC